jgi:hypothetical protein
MEGYAKKYHLAVGWNPIDKAAGGQSDIVSLKNYQVAEFWLITGAAITATFAVTMQQGVSISAAATALAFTRYFDSGCRLKYDTVTVSQAAAAAGETILATSTAVGTVYEDLGGEVILYNRNETAFVDNEVITFSGGKVAAANGVLYDEDIMIPRVATANTFDVTQVHDANRRFMVPIHASMLTPPNDCVALTMGNPTLAVCCCFVVLSEPRYKNIPMPSAIYN